MSQHPEKHISRTNEVFSQKKADILNALGQPDGAYTDLSPKGSVDTEIRDLIDMINASEECVTTSSCAGRISVFVEAGSKPHKHSTEHDDLAAKSSPLEDDEVSSPPAYGELPPQKHVSGDEKVQTSMKGNGGRWLYVSHQPIDLDKQESDLHSVCGLTQSSASVTRQKSNRFVHFKFEPMILHIFTSSVRMAQLVLSAAQQAGFRESGVSSLTSPCPMVAVRSSGLALESIIGVIDRDEDSAEETATSIVDEEVLRMLVGIADRRFEQNAQRISRFQENLAKQLNPLREVDTDSDNAKEDKEVRRLRKKAEGLMRQQGLHKENSTSRLDRANAVRYEIEREYAYLEDVKRAEAKFDGRMM